MFSRIASRFWDGVFGLIERQTSLDRISQPLEKAVGKGFALAGKPVQDALNGSWFGHPLHPAATDVPIGAWTTALVLDLLEPNVSRRRRSGYRRATDDAITLGIVGAVGAALSGLADWQHLKGKSQRVGLVHALLNTTALSLYIASLAARKRGDRAQGRFLARLGWGTIFASAHLGGHLVYRERVGVTHADAREQPREFTPVIAEYELREGQPRRVDLDGMRIVLVRRDGQIHALGEVCSHLGGPLSEGRVEGETIECPWHASRFGLTDGEVQHGPAVHPAPCFEVRLRDGMVELRHVAALEPQPAQERTPALAGAASAGAMPRRTVPAHVSPAR